MLAALATLVCVALWTTSGVSAQQGGPEVDVQVEVGDRGLVAGGAAMPIRVTMESERARTVDVSLEWNGGYRTYRTELPPGAPVDLDLSVPTPADRPDQVRVDVTDDGRRVGSDQAEVTVTTETTLVGIGSSLASAGAPESSPTVAGVQVARLVELSESSWSRPGWLDSMSTVVLGAQDVDRLEEVQVTQLRSWIWRGGELIVDTVRAEVLPVVELPAAAGSRTEVGAGWVRFSGGDAALGAWSTVLEPAMVRTRMVPPMDFWMGDGSSLTGLIDVEFLSVWVIVAAVFGSALLAGPGLWFVLRSRQRRRMMWVAAPGVSLLVAALLLVLGQGVFTRAEVSAASSIVVDPWKGSGSVSMGVKDSVVLELPAGAELIASSPAALVTDTGAGSTASIDLGRNSFGMLGVSPVDLEEGPTISMTATANDHGSVDVTVTNGTESDLVGVVVQGASRARNFDDVPAGESVTLPFEVVTDIAPFAAMFDPSSVPMDPAGMGMGMGVDDMAMVGPRWFGSAVDPSLSVPMSRGLVIVTGSLVSDITALGRTLPGRSEITAIAPVTSAAPSDAGLRIDAVGPRPPAPDPDAEIFDDGTAVVEQPAELTWFPQYVRLSAAAGRPSAPCGVHTLAKDLRHWNGTEWIPAENLGAPRISDRLTGQEVQDWAIPEIPVGGTLLVAVSMALPAQTPLLFDCVSR